MGIKVLVNILFKEFRSKSIRIKEKDKFRKKNFIDISLFPAVGYKEGKAIFWISPIVLSYLQHLKKNFTKFSLDQIAKLDSSYSIRIYMLLNQYQSKGERVFQVDSFKKKILGISNLYIGQFNDFKKDILFKMKEEINEKTDLYINFEIEKSGRRADKIIFSIKARDNQLQQAINLFLKEMDKILCQKIQKFPTDHKTIQKQWKDSKKNIGENYELFREWLENRIDSFDELSKEKLVLKSEEKKNDIASWYYKILDSNLKKRLLNSL